MTKGRVVIISAPSGGGKTTIIHRLLSKHKNMTYSISCTTRPIRPGETDGKDYHFIDDATFKKMMADGRLAEWNKVHDHHYGTPIEPLEKWLSEGKDVLLDLDVIGGLKLVDLYRDCAISIFLLPPSREELEKRLASRKTDSKEVQKLRLKNALTELTYKDKFDHQVINDDLEKAYREVEEILGYAAA